MEQLRDDFEAALIKKLVPELMIKANGLSEEAAESIVRHTWLERDGDGYKAVVPNYAWWFWQEAKRNGA